MARSTKTPQLQGRRAVLALITLAQEPNASDIGAFRVIGAALDYRLNTDASEKFVEGFKRFDLAELIRSAQSASIESLDKIKALGAANSHRLRGQFYENTKSTLADTIAIARAAGQSGNVVGERVRHVEDTGAGGKRLTGQHSQRKSELAIESIDRSRFFHWPEKHSQRKSGLAIESATGDFAYSITAARRQGVAGMHCLEATLMTSQATPKFNGSREVELALRVLGTPDVLVDLCDTRGRARLNGGSILAAVGEPFELFFRLAGTNDAGVLLELYHPGTDLNVTPFALDEHFSVTAEPRQATPEGCTDKKEIEKELAINIDDENRKRRYLSVTERAFLAVDRIKEDGFTICEAAKEMEVSPRTVDMAKRITERGSQEVIKAVRKGEIIAQDANRVSDLPKQTQTAALRAVREGRAKSLSEATGRKRKSVLPPVFNDGPDLDALKASSAGVVPVIVNSLIPVPEWLLQFPEGGVRQVFEHLAAHGVVTESEATKMLGGPRELRSFAREFDKLVALSPFRVRIETVAGVKRYVREGI